MSREAHRPALLAELERQDARLHPSEARRNSLARLRAGAPAVITGQQVGLFLGPAYAIYKAATAVVEARARDAVPVFWLQAEDHDGAEVSPCRVLAWDAVRTIVVAPPGPERASLAHRVLGAAVDEGLRELADALADAPHRDATLALLRAAYRPSEGWVDAFAKLMSQLFADEGLVVFHPRTAAVAELARPVHRWAIERAEAIDAHLAAAPDPQVKPRPGCLLSFFHPEGPAGPRFRPTREGNGYRVPDALLSSEELVDWLAREPLRFSTSALLRPLLQDHLFPTAAYVGGPSELRYLAQVRPLYDDFGLPMPALVPRARFVVTDPPCRRRLAALGLAAVDIEASEDALLDRLAPSDGPDGQTVRETLLAPLVAELAKLRRELPDASLDRAFGRTERGVERALGALADRIDAHRRRRDETLSDRLSYLRCRLVPDGQPQERHLSFPHFAARFGPRAFVEAAIAAVGDDRALQELPSWP